jgi:predicted MPP superfamily phosphohydrolase
LRWLALLILAGFIILGKGYWNAMRDPIVREASVAMPNWPEGSAPIKVLLIADTHVAGPDMSPERLTRILRQLNATKPDLILLAGDYISEKAVATHIYTPAELAAPFAVLKAQLGIVAVPGNHDHWADLDGIIAELRKNGVTVIANSAVKRGPLVIGGVDDDYTDHDNLAATYAAMDALEVQGAKAPRLLLTHGPDVVPDLPTPVGAVLTGHTHCGQIVLPLIGAISYVSRYGDRFACGDIKDKGPDGAIQRVFVTAGLGTSILPLRYGAHPDVWLITLGPRGRK